MQISIQSENKTKQECISVGCVPSTAVAVLGGRSALGCVPKGVSA